MSTKVVILTSPPVTFLASFPSAMRLDEVFPYMEHRYEHLVDPAWAVVLGRGVKESHISYHLMTDGETFELFESYRYTEVIFRPQTMALTIFLPNGARERLEVDGKVRSKDILGIWGQKTGRDLNGMKLCAKNMLTTAVNDSMKLIEVDPQTGQLFLLRLFWPDDVNAFKTEGELDWAFPQAWDTLFRDETYPALMEAEQFFAYGITVSNYDKLESVMKKEKSALLPKALRSSKTWKAVKAAIKQMKGKKKAMIQREFLGICLQNRFFGCLWFPVHAQLPNQKAPGEYQMTASRDSLFFVIGNDVIYTHSMRKVKKWFVAGKKVLVLELRMEDKRFVSLQIMLIDNRRASMIDDFLHQFARYFNKKLGVTTQKRIQELKSGRSPQAQARRRISDSGSMPDSAEFRPPPPPEVQQADQQPPPEPVVEQPIPVFFEPPKKERRVTIDDSVCPTVPSMNASPVQPPTSTRSRSVSCLTPEMAPEVNEIRKSCPPPERKLSQDNLYVEQVPSSPRAQLRPPTPPLREDWEIHMEDFCFEKPREQFYHAPECSDANLNELMAFIDKALEMKKTQPVEMARVFARALSALLKELRARQDVIGFQMVLAKIHRHITSEMIKYGLRPVNTEAGYLTRAEACLFGMDTKLLSIVGADAGPPCDLLNCATMMYACQLLELVRFCELKSIPLTNCTVPDFPVFDPHLASVVMSALGQVDLDDKIREASASIKEYLEFLAKPSMTYLQVLSNRPAFYEMGYQNEFATLVKMAGIFTRLGQNDFAASIRQRADKVYTKKKMYRETMDHFASTLEQYKNFATFRRLFSYSIDLAKFGVLGVGHEMTLFSFWCLPQEKRLPTFERTKLFFTSTLTQVCQLPTLEEQQKFMRRVVTLAEMIVLFAVSIHESNPRAGALKDHIAKLREFLKSCQTTKLQSLEGLQKILTDLSAVSPPPPPSHTMARTQPLRLKSLDSLTGGRRESDPQADQPTGPVLVLRRLTMG